MTETREVRIPPSGDPFTAVTREPAASDYASARRTFRIEMYTGPDPYADPAWWIGCSDGEAEDEF